MATAPVSKGQSTQVEQIFVKTDMSVGFEQYRFQPIIPPTIACEVETDMPIFAIQYTVMAADSATINEPPNAFTAPKAPKVSVPPCPPYTAPIITKIDEIRAAVLNFTIFEPTAVPKMLEASFAPKDQLKKNK